MRGGSGVGDGRPSFVTPPGGRPRPVCPARPRSEGSSVQGRLRPRFTTRPDGGPRDPPDYGPSLSLDEGRSPSSGEVGRRRPFRPRRSSSVIPVGRRPPRSAGATRRADVLGEGGGAARTPVSAPLDDLRVRNVVAERRTALAPLTPCAGPGPYGLNQGPFGPIIELAVGDSPPPHRPSASISDRRRPPTLLREPNNAPRGVPRFGPSPVHLVPLRPPAAPRVIPHRSEPQCVEVNPSAGAPVRFPPTGMHLRHPGPMNDPGRVRRLNP